MIIRVKTLIAATALATLSATCAYAGGTDLTGSLYGGGWGGNASSSSTAIGSDIANHQVTLQNNWSSLNGNIESVGGDAVVTGAAAGNLMDITTMNNTRVNSSQIVGSSATIGSDINANANNVWGSVGVSNQVVCNGLSVSTDPTLASTRSYQKCAAADPASSINTSLTNIAGDAVVQGSSLGNSFEADSNAPNMPVWNKQMNNSNVASTINASVYGIGGSTSLSSSAIGNTGQIIHYSTN